MDMTSNTTRRTETIPGKYEPFHHPPIPQKHSTLLLSNPPPPSKKKKKTGTYPSIQICIYIVTQKLSLGPSSRPTIIKTPSSERERSAEDLDNFISTLQKVDAKDLGPDRLDRECRICFEPYRKCAVMAAAAAATTTTTTPPDDASGSSLHLSISISGQGEEDPLRLPCNHIFGQQCLEHWLRKRDQCPNCRRVLLPSIIDDPVEVVPDLVFFVDDDDGDEYDFYDSDESQPGSVLEEEESETEVDDDEPSSLGLAEASNIQRLLTNIVLEGKYRLESGRYLMDLIGEVINLVDLYQSLPGAVDDLRARNEKFNLVIAAASEWIRNE